MEDRFSPQHSFTRSEVEAAHKADKGRSLLVRVTTGYRNLALRQFLANQFAFVAAVPLIFGTAYWEQPISRDLLAIWLSIAMGSWLFRLAAYYRVFKVPRD